MLTHYIEISIRPDPEFTESMLLNALLSKYHRASVELKNRTVGLSFPAYSHKPRTLGNIVRIHADKAVLEELMNLGWLKGMRDHLLCADIQRVPNDAKYCTFSRKQFKTSAERLRRRRMQRKGENYEQAALNVPVTVERKTDLPFATLRSSSTGQTYPLFISRGEILSENKAGEFNSYGLSAIATVPWF